MRKIADDDCAVVKLVHALGDEDGDEQFARHDRVERVTLVQSDELVQVGVLFERDDGSDAMPREFRRGFHHLVDRL